ncbi:MAG: glycoside hydrolase family 3 C-terminal domain-containing protein [Prevotella sp.]|nr:glycoside hydrolase family 3 C-terminal domain-containing protein [Prevotella sp.]
MKIKTMMMMGATALMTACQTTVSDLELEQMVDELYQRMPQEERIAQLQSMYMDELFDEQGQLDTVKCKELIPYGIGHFSQFCMQKPRDPNELRDRVAVVQEWLMTKTPNKIPALFHEEVLSGVNTRGATIYPQQIGQACSFNPELAEVKTRQTSTAMRKMGGVLSLSPMVDVCRTPSFNRLEESYGEDGYLSAVMGVAFVRGLQQGDLRKGVGACSKHYLGYGGGGDAEEKVLMEEILMPHEAMIRLAGSKAVMPGYHAMAGQQQQCVADSMILKNILRGYLGFDGMVVSDYTAIDQLVKPSAFPEGKEWSPIEKAAAAINGGCDVDFPTGANYRFLQEAIDSGLVAQETLERAVKDVLRYKFRAGLFDSNPNLYAKSDIQLDTPEERQTSYEIATQSIVLLQNDSSILPLKGESLRILLTGPNANTMWAMCGDYSFPAMTYFWKRVEEDLDHPHVITLLEGMRDKLPEGDTLLYSRGCDWTEEIETKFSHAGDERAWEYPILHRKVDAGEEANKEEALAMADSADVIIAAVGENVMLCGENRDRQGLRLPGKQEEYVEALLATGKPVVLVVFGGRAQVIAGLAERCAAVIQAWYPGEEGGHAVADILYGNVSPSAKLAVSYPNKEIYTPICYNDAIEPDSCIQWPFGYGLSYTTFEYKHMALDEEAKTTDEYIDLSFEVKNTGKVSATEIAQLYISPADSTQSLRPIQLQGFARVELEPRHSKTIKVRLYTEQLGFYSHEGGERSWNILPGKYVVKIGASSADIRLEETLTLVGESVRKPLREHYFSGIEVVD